MHQLVIAKKMKEGNIEFLDFAVDDDTEKLLVFSKFKEASDFLKEAVGSGEQLLDYMVTTTESQSENPRYQNAASKGVLDKSAIPMETEQVAVEDIAPENVVGDVVPESSNEVEVFFSLDCVNVDVVNNEVLVEKLTGKKFAAVIGFLDLDTQTFIQKDDWKLKAVFISNAEDKFNVK